jgi:hypothetical protein
LLEIFFVSEEGGSMTLRNLGEYAGVHNIAAQMIARFICRDVKHIAVKENLYIFETVMDANMK